VGADAGSEEQMSETYMMPVEEQPFNVVDAVVGVVVRPVATMAKIAAARPWRTALLIMVALAVLSALVGLTTPIQPLPATPDAETPPQMAWLLALSQTRTPVIVAALVAPFLQLIYIGILFLLARLLGGRGEFSALFSTTVFAGIPGVLTLPLTLIANLSGVAALTFVLSPVSFIISMWSLLLQIYGVRASMNLSTGRAVATVLIPIGVLLFLACVAAIIFTAVIIAAVRSTIPDFSTFPTPVP
jgi:hypothetical protein